MSLIDFVFRPLRTLRSERLKPHEDVVIRPEKRAQIQGPTNIWSNRAKLPAPPTTANDGGASVASQMVRLNIPRGQGQVGGPPQTNSFSAAAASDFPAL